MSPRKFTKPLCLLAGLALSGAVFAPSRAAADETQEDAQVIVVHGNGEVRVAPDSLSVDVGVEARAATVDEAENKVNAAAQRIVEEMKRLGDESLKVETKVVQVSPVYGPDRPNQPPVIAGFSASNHVSVTLRAVAPEELGARGSRIIDTAIRAGANNIGGVDFFLDDPSAAQDDALSAAVRDAQHGADTMARAAGVTLGPLYSLEETPGMRVVPRAFAAVAREPSSTPIEAQDIVVQSSVTAKYTFH